MTQLELKLLYCKKLLQLHVTVGREHSLSAGHGGTLYPEGYTVSCTLRGGDDRGYSDTVRLKTDELQKHHEKLQRQLQSTLHDRVGKFATTCTAHGILPLYLSRGWCRRAVWVTVLLCMVGWGCYQCYNVTTEYLTYPKKVTIGVEEAIVVEFPAVTVCNLNPLPSKDQLRNDSKWMPIVQIEDDYNENSCGDYSQSGDTTTGGTTSTHEVTGNHNDTRGVASGSYDASTDAAAAGDAGEDANLPALRKTRAAPGEVFPPMEEDPLSGSIENPSLNNGTANANGPTTQEVEHSETINENTARKVKPGKKGEDKPEMKEETKGASEQFRRLKRQTGNVKEDNFASREMIRFLSFDEFNKVNKDRLIKFNNSTTYKVQMPKNRGTVNISDDESIRLNCTDGYYRFLRYLNTNHESLNDDTPLSFETSNNELCQKENYTLDISFSLICRLPVFCDKFGCFDYNLKEYTAVVSMDDGNLTNNIYCSSCSDYCWYFAWFKDTSGITQEGVIKILQNSRTPDLSDVIDTFSPDSETIERYKTPADKFIITCSHDRKSCSHANFLEWTSDQYGKCYTYNSAFKAGYNNTIINTKPKKTSSVGPSNGLRLTINIQQNNYVALLSQEIGLRMIVHSPYQLPFPEDEGFNVSPGNSINVVVTTKKLEKVGEPHGDCKLKGKSQIFKEYSSLRCKKICIERHFWIMCGCYVGKSPVYDIKGLIKPNNSCSLINAKEKLCMDKVMFLYQQQLLNCICPQACKETVYESRVTLAEENRPFYNIIQKLLNRTLGDSLCSKKTGLVRIHLYLDSLTYEIIRESPAYTWDTLVSNVGGALGLFIGMSLITIVEFLELMVDVILLCFQSRWKSKPDSQMKTVAPTRSTVHSLKPTFPTGKQPFTSNASRHQIAKRDSTRASEAFNRIFADF
ncbi:uncharacterized protein [Procambarus clarkii]|uniref:uncharacterized protein isoform X2 n=1 Tax=Procambarus clarkii TaxID=6728 RepID=UPI003743D8BF